MSLKKGHFTFFIFFVFGHAVTPTKADDHIVAKDNVDRVNIQYHLSLNGNYSRNTAEQLLLTTNNFISLNKKRLTFSQSFMYQYGTLRPKLSAPKEQLQNELQSVTKFSYNIRKFEPFAIAGYESSHLRSISNREYIAAGTEYYLLKKPMNSMSVLGGIAYEWCDYTTTSKYNDIFFVGGFKGLQQLAKGRYNLLYNCYFFKKTEAGKWRYNAQVMALVKLYKPLYFTTGFILSDEQILGTETVQQVSTVTFGITFRKFSLQ
jgi:hypothetical protein